MTDAQSKERNSRSEGASSWLRTRWARNVAIAICVLLALYIIGLVAAYRWQFSTLSGEHENWGQFGDFFGGAINPVFAFLSFILLLVTIWMQADEMRLSRLELEETKKAFVIQNSILVNQERDRAFFTLLEIHRELRNTFTHETNGPGKQSITGLCLAIVERATIALCKRLGKTSLNLTDIQGLNCETVASTLGELRFRNDVLDSAEVYLKNLRLLIKYSNKWDRGSEEAIAMKEVLRSQISIEETKFLTLYMAIVLDGEMYRELGAWGNLQHEENEHMAIFYNGAARHLSQIFQEAGEKVLT